MIKVVNDNKQLLDMKDSEQMLLIKSGSKLIFAHFDGDAYCWELSKLTAPAVHKALKRLKGRFLTYNAKEMQKFLMEYGHYHMKWFCVKLNSQLLAKGGEVPDVKWENPEMNVADVDKAADALMQIVLDQLDGLKNNGLLAVAEIEWSAVPAFATMEKYGAPVNPSQINKLILKYTSEKEYLAKEAQAFLPGENINLESNVELLEKFKEMKLKMKKPDGKLVDVTSTNKRTLSQIVDRAAMVQALIAYRTSADTLEKLNSLKKFIKDKKIFATFNQIGAGTGRTSTQDPNLAGLPEHLRPLICGMPFITADYDQQELKIIAFLSQDPTLIKAFKNGDDIHSVTSYMLFGKYANKGDVLREVAKAVNFGLAYGEGEETLAINIGKTLKEAKEIMKIHQGRFPKVYSTLSSLGQEGLKNGYAKSICGRIRVLEKSNEGAIIRAAANMSIQGTAADMIKMAMGIMVESYDKFPFYIWNSVYDEVSVISKDRQSEVSNIVQNGMHRAMKTIIPGIPPSCTIKQANNWL